LHLAPLTLTNVEENKELINSEKEKRF